MKELIVMPAGKHASRREKLQLYLLKYYTKHTAKAYLREIDIFLENNARAEKYVHAEIVNYMGGVRKRYKNPATLNRILAALKVYYEYLCNEGLRKDNPAKSIILRDKLSKDIQLQDLFTTEELEALMNRKEYHNNLGYRNKVMISILIYQGLKPKEMEALRLEDINLSEGSIYIRASPKTNSRTLSLKPNQILLFQHYITEIRVKLLKGNSSNSFIIGERGNPFTGEDLTKHVKRSFKKLYSPRKVNVMTIRQSVIANLLKQNNDLRIVQVFAGHKYPSTTERYKQNEVETLQTAVNKFHPIN